MSKLLDAGCHVVATMWKALKMEWHWLGCAKPALLGKSRIFLFLLIFILIFPCSCFNKGNGTVNIDDKCICINTGVFVDHAIDYQLYLNDSLLVFGETQNRIADTFKCTPFKMHGDKRSLRIVSKYAQIDSLLYISVYNLIHMILLTWK